MITTAKILSRAARRQKMRGFSLIELMVSVTISLMVLVAVSYVFVASKRTYSVQDRLARVQENARFAIQFISRDLRMAGYSGCMDEVSSVNNTLNTGFTFNPSVAIEGLENATGSWYPSGNTTAIPTNIKAGSDAIMLRMADPSLLISVTRPMPNESAEINVSAVTGLAANDIVMISDCSSADVMQITAVQTASSKIQHIPGGASSPGNATQRLSKQYKENAKVMRYVARSYYLKNKTDPNDPGKTIPSLYMSENGGAEQELVEGVEDMQITYGVDTDPAADGIPNSYRKPGDAGLNTASEWSRVKSIRIAFLVRSIDDKDYEVDARAGSNIDVNGKSFAIPANDKYQRRIFLTTIQLRNT